MRKKRNKKASCEGKRATWPCVSPPPCSTAAAHTVVQANINSSRPLSQQMHLHKHAGYIASRVLIKLATVAHHAGVLSSINCTGVLHTPNKSALCSIRHGPNLFGSALLEHTLWTLQHGLRHVNRAPTLQDASIDLSAALNSN